MSDLALRDLVLVNLPRRRADAIRIGELAKDLMAPKRDVEEALQELAQASQYPICASTQPPYGVWLGTDADVREYLGKLGARVSHQRQRMDGLERYLRNLPTPQLWDLEGVA